MSRPECAVPLRNFLGTAHGVQVARSCGRMKVAWTVGACSVLSVGLLAAHFFTKRRNEESPDDARLILPMWLATLPLAFACFTALSAVAAAESYWRAEELHFATSEMAKKDYLAYRVVDDRLKTSSGVALAGTSFIGATSLFGPFLRADNR